MRQRATRNVTLLQPSSEMTYGSGKTVWPPMGLMNLAASLRLGGRHVTIVDAILEGFDRDTPWGDDTFLMGLTPQESAQRVLASDPDVVGVSCLFVNQMEPALQTARRVRELKPDCILVWGGPVITLNPDKFVGRPEVDALVMGDGDHSLPALLDAISTPISEAKVPPGTGLKIDGDFLLDRNYVPLRDLDALPPPARDLVDMPAYMDAVKAFRYQPRAHPATTMLTARGCPRKCNFCSSPYIYNRKYATLSAERVVAEIDELVEMHGVRELVILDENFAINRRRVDQILDLMIERDYGLSWYCASGIEIMSLTEEILEKMVRAGLYKLKISFESGNERVLREIVEKPVDLKRGEQVVRRAKELGIAVGANFIIGFPWETREEILDSFEYAKRLEFDFTLWNIATPYPNTRLTTRAIQDGLLSPDFDYEELKPGKAFFNAVDVTLEELEKLRHDFWHELHFSTPERAARYHRYAPLNANYREPRKPEPGLPPPLVASR